MEQYNYQQYVGKKIRGFSFTGHPSYNSSMKKYDEKIGVIKYAGNTIFTVCFFDGSEWNYPLDLGLCYIVDENGNSFSITKRNIFNYFDKLKKILRNE